MREYNVYFHGPSISPVSDYNRKYVIIKKKKNIYVKTIR